MENEKEIKEEIIEDIKCGSVKMCPKWHFFARNALFLLATILILLAVLMLVSFTVFSLHQTGAWSCSVFSASGLFMFIKYLPWLVVMVSATLIIALLAVLRHYSLVSQKPLIFSLLGILLVATAGGIATAPLHQAPFQRAENNNLPFVGPIYMNYSRQMPEETSRGIIYRMATSGFAIKTDYGEDINVILLNRNAPSQGNNFAPGDNIMVFGKKDPNIIYACGVSKINEIPR